MFVLVDTVFIVFVQLIWARVLRCCSLPSSFLGWHCYDQITFAWTHVLAQSPWLHMVKPIRKLTYITWRWGRLMVSGTKLLVFAGVKNNFMFKATVSFCKECLFGQLCNWLHMSDYHKILKQQIALHNCLCHRNVF